MTCHTEKIIKINIPLTEFKVIQTFCDFLVNYFDWDNKNTCANMKTIFKAIRGWDYDTLDKMGIILSHNYELKKEN